VKTLSASHKRKEEELEGLAEQLSQAEVGSKRLAHLVHC
jgi:hypothetical protein